MSRSGKGTAGRSASIGEHAFSGVLHHMAKKLPPTPRQIIPERTRHGYGCGQKVTHTDEQVKDAIRRRLAGEKAGVVAASLGTSVDVLRQWCQGTTRANCLDEVEQELWGKKAK